MKTKKLLYAMAAASITVSAASAVPAAHAAEQKSEGTAVRAMVTDMQGTLKWNTEDKSANVSLGNTTAVLQAGSAKAVLQGAKVTLDQAPYIKEGKLYISAAAAKQLRSGVIAAQNRTGYELAGSFQMPSGKAEIAASTPDGSRLLVTEADEGSVSVLDITYTDRVSELKKISFHSLSDKAEVTSVAVMPDGKHAIAVIRAGDNFNDPNPGMAAVIDLSTYEIVKVYEIGIGPDSIAISRDGSYAVIAIEDEELDPETEEFDYAANTRPGSIAVLHFQGGDVLAGELVQVPVDLSGIKGAVYPHEPQPEYVSISPDSTTAAVTMQENNTIAIVDLPTQKLVRVFALGTTTHAADAKDDDRVSLTDEITARYEPDGIAFTSDGQYLLTANEGDLSEDEFTDGVKAGGRNIAVWSLEGEKIYDSADLIDKAAAQVGLYPDGRSEKKGSEVENLTIAQVNGRDIAAVASERADAILFFDLSDPKSPALLGLIPTAGESPEGIHHVSTRDMFISADEGTGTISFYKR
ncbi:stalk domain-containing protein [Paenibacillus sp. P96]|uniref:Stalk domain-containing protein n=1 Tax=Paenibacillus zeirhizosphaerae TaxID=2987519 RepID=A0ABT9FKQ7_9BACL|nr:stalk domain-containing protein [Paenibacillus sp. P96]MDP4095274.1 stalk domain-containing protein [Paenibacillus sp. P96]